MKGSSLDNRLRYVVCKLLMRNRQETASRRDSVWDSRNDLCQCLAQPRVRYSTPLRPRRTTSGPYSMDYLRNLGSAAASSILQKSGLSLPFALGEKISGFEGETIFTLHNAVKRVGVLHCQSYWGGRLIKSLALLFETRKTHLLYLYLSSTYQLRQIAET
jgi:hypothetical protein